MSAGLLVALAFLIAGCGGSKAPSVASVATTTTRASTPAAGTTAAGAAGSAGVGSQSQLQQDLLKYSTCMRANGVPDFPDPGPHGGFQIQAGSGINFASSVFKAAQSKCSKLLPNGGPPAAGSTTHPSPGWLQKMDKAAACMRGHGITDFPDPTTTVPSMPAGGGVISDIEGVIFAFPSSLDMQSPLFVRAANVCGFPLHNH